MYEWQVNGLLSMEKAAPYTLATVITGEGELIVDEKTYPLTMGTSFILPNQIERWEIKGELKLIASEPGK